MLEIRRVLCPVDLSDASRHALEHAGVIARWYGAGITVLHVSPSPLVLEGPLLFAASPVSSATTNTAEREKLHAQLDCWVEPLRSAGLTVVVQREEGHSPAERILACAAHLPADLLVMGTHGRSGFERFVLGSVTERVLRKASCAVLTVPPPAVRAATPPFKRMLCPVDFSDSSVAALRFALSIAAESDARLTALNVLDLPADEELYDAFDTPEFRLRCEETARRRLDRLVAGEVREFCSPRTRLSWGKAYRQILEVADEEATDLIVMGVHGRNALDLMLFGSTTNQIVRHATCPVLTLKG